MTQPTERIRDLLVRTASEREATSALNIALGDAYLRRQLQLGISLLDFVDGYFLEPNILAEQRTSAQWVSWLGEAEKALAQATQIRDWVDDAIRDFCPNVRTIST